MTAVYLTGFGIALVVCAVVLIPIRRYASVLGLLDAPNERSSHRVITPRGGGIAIILGAAASLALLSARLPEARTWILFGAASLVGAVGAIDDRREVSALVRLTVHALAAFLVVRALGPVEAVALPGGGRFALVPLLAWTLSVFWLVAVTNFFNFMDGIDGLAGGQALATCIGVVVAGWASDASTLAMVVAGSCVGFLFHNWPPARIFMGDSGSGFLGLLLAALPMFAPAGQKAHAILAISIGLTLFLFDPVVTLIRRALAGKNIFQAHREHLYQQLVQPEEPAGRVTTWYTLTALVLALFGAAGFRNADLMWLACGASLLAFVIVSSLAAGRRSSRMQQRAADH